MTNLCHHPENVPALDLPNTILEKIGTLTLTEYLGHGFSNHHWRLTTENHCYIWRQFGPTPPGANRANERLALTHLQAFPWAPKLVIDSSEGILFEAALETSPRGEISSTQRQQLIQAIITLWQQQIPLSQMDYPKLIRHYATLASTIDTKPVSQLMDIAHRWKTDQFCVIHQDIHIDNLVMTDTGFLLIDWEYAVIGNPWIDAIALDRMLSLTQDEKNLIQQHLPDLEIKHPWQAMHQWLNQLDQLWFAAQKAKLVVE